MSKAEIKSTIILQHDASKHWDMDDQVFFKKTNTHRSEVIENRSLKMVMILASFCQRRVESLDKKWPFEF